MDTSHLRRRTRNTQTFASFFRLSKSNLYYSRMLVRTSFPRLRDYGIDCMGAPLARWSFYSASGHQRVSPMPEGGAIAKPCCSGSPQYDHSMYGMMPHVFGYVSACLNIYWPSPCNSTTYRKQASTQGYKHLKRCARGRVLAMLHPTRRPSHFDPAMFFLAKFNYMSSAA